jgi:hypothetical protein
MENKINLRLPILVTLLIMAAFSRLLPHPANFTPIGAMALFGAAYFSNRILAFALPVLAMWISDVVIDNTLYAKYYHGFQFIPEGWFWIYGTILLTTLMGIFLLKKVNIANVIIASIAASILYFALTNFACLPEYPSSFAGFISCYKSGLPFFPGTLFGNLFYSSALFGSYTLVRRKYPLLVKS